MKKESNCLYCQNSFRYDDKSSSGKYCSNICQGKYKIEYISKPIIEQGLCKQNSTLKKYLENERGYKCESCSIFKWNGQQLSLHVDHIDGNTDNNFPNNIRLLCPNCHSLTNTFSGRNKKNSKRSSYMKKYREKRMVGEERIELPTSAV